MRTCPACSFENMNTAATCGRCGAKLIWDGPTDPDSFRPPRAGRRKRLHPLALLYAVKAPWLPTLPTALGRLPSERVAAVALSIVPGLGHWYLGEKVEGTRMGLIWLAPLALGFLGYHFAPRLFLGAAPLLWIILMVTHCFAVFSVARPQRYCQSVGEARVVSAVLMGLVLTLYLVTGYIIQSFLQVPVGVRVRL